jgi:fatty acid desaturase
MPHSSLPLSRAQVDLLQAELDDLRQEVIADLGERDARHIRSIVHLSRLGAAGGRTLLMFGIGPFTWVLGVGALATAKILENMEIGHNVMHGQYDWMNDPALCSQTYEWDNVCDSEQWRHYHNFVHHTYTNIVGEDRDFGYGFFRLSTTQPWAPYHLVQPVTAVVLGLLFQWGVGLHDLELEERVRDRDTEALASRARPFLRKAARQLWKDYVLFPALALANAPRVFAGNLVANLVRNVWTHVVIFCGHFPDGVREFTKEETRNETRGDWYVRQLVGSANIEGSRLFHVLTGHLSHQIEHHVFPDLPAHRYPEIAPRVRAICERYGLGYETGGLLRQYATVFRRIVRHAVPWSPAFI